MNSETELRCTQNPETGQWLVWFPRHLGGMQVLEEFDTEAEARAFWQDQIDDE